MGKRSAAAKVKKPKFDPVKIKVEYEVTVDPSWIETVAHDVDMFMNSYCGYWMRRIDVGNRCQLAWEFDGKDQEKRFASFKAAKNITGARFINDLSNEEENEFHAEAIAAFKAGTPLPPCYFRMDEALAVKAWKMMIEWKTAGVVTGGFDWYENSDANSYDVALQLAMLGEVVYG